MIEGKFVTFTAIGVYVEKSILPHLALKWKNSAAEELKNRLGDCGDFPKTEGSSALRLLLSRMSCFKRWSFRSDEEMD